MDNKNNKNKETVIIDIREIDEYNAEHISWSINIPMSSFDNWWRELLRKYKWKELVILCRSWWRAKISEEIIKEECNCNVRVYEWWIIKWKEKWNKVKQIKKNHLPILRQVQVTVWLLIIVFWLLAYFISNIFIILSIFIWSWLLYAWITWSCMLASIIAKLPHNK